MCGLGFQSLEAQDCLQCVGTVRKSDKLGETEGLDDCSRGDTVPDETELVLAWVMHLDLMDR